MSSYFWSCWHHWLHHQWPKWQHFCASSPALLLGLSGVGWLGSKPQLCTGRRVLRDRPSHHFPGHEPVLLEKKKSRIRQEIIERSHLGGRFLVSQLISFLSSLTHFYKSLLIHGHTNNSWLKSIELFPHPRNFRVKRKDTALSCILLVTLSCYIGERQWNAREVPESDKIRSKNQNLTAASPCLEWTTKWRWFVCSTSWNCCSLCIGLFCGFNVGCRGCYCTSKWEADALESSPWRTQWLKSRVPCKRLACNLCLRQGSPTTSTLALLQIQNSL